MTRKQKTWALTLVSSSGAVFTLLATMLLSRLFNKHDYATYRQALMVFRFTAPLLALGLPHALFYFIPLDPGRAKTILTGILLTLSAMGFSFFLFCLLVASRWLPDQFDNLDLGGVLPWVGLYGLSFLLMSAVQPYLIIQEKISMLIRFTMVTQGVIFLMLVGSIFLVACSPRIAVASQSVGAFFMLGVMLFLIYRVLPEKAEIPRWAEMRKQVFFSAPMGIGIMLDGLAMGIDKWLVASLCSPRDFAIFVNGAMEIPFLGMLVGAVSALILPEIVLKFKEGQKGEALMLWNKVVRRTAFLLFPVAGVLYLAAPNLMTALYSSEYEQSARPFRIYLLLIPAKAIFINMIFYSEGRMDLILKRAVSCLILNALLSYFLIKKIGLNGAAIGTVFVFWFYLVPFCLWNCARILDKPVTRIMSYGYLAKMAVFVVLPVSGLLILGWGLEWVGAGWLAVQIFFYSGIVLGAFFLFFRDEFDATLSLFLIRGWRRGEGKTGISDSY